MQKCTPQATTFTCVTRHHTDSGMKSVESFTAIPSARPAIIHTDSHNTSLPPPLVYLCDGLSPVPSFVCSACTPGPCCKGGPLLSVSPASELVAPPAVGCSAASTAASATQLPPVARSVRHPPKGALPTSVDGGSMVGAKENAAKSGLAGRLG